MPRTADILLAILLLVILLPLFMALALFIWISTGRPILFRQQRTGRDGVPFVMYKFRTMASDAGRHGDLTFRADNRITAAGRFLRHYKLDELPQLLNIVQGDMKFVGPRPELPNWTSRYSVEEREILRVLPGLTDSVQLLFRHEQSFLENAVQYEWLFREKVVRQLQYQAVRTPMTDLMVILRTIPAILRVEPRAEEIAVYERIRRLAAHTEPQ